MRKAMLASMAATVIFVPRAARATQFGSGIITAIYVQNYGGTSGQGSVAIQFAGTSVTGTTACVTNGNADQFIIDLGTASGRAIYAAALAAYQSASQFAVQGANSCTNGIENVTYAQFL